MSIAEGYIVGTAAEKLKAEGINATAINIGTIKPLDKELIVKVANETGK